MIATQDPELVVLFADADAQAMIETLIERGIERKCLRPFRWRSVREPMRDAVVAQNPSRALSPFLNVPTIRFAVIWDMHGSGLDCSVSEAEAGVVNHFARVDVEAQRVVAIAFEPELEVALVPVWSRVVELMANERRNLPTI